MDLETIASLLSKVGLESWTQVAFYGVAILIAVAAQVSSMYPDNKLWGWVNKLARNVGQAKNDPKVQAPE